MTKSEKRDALLAVIKRRRAEFLACAKMDPSRRRARDVGLARYRIKRAKEAFNRVLRGQPALNATDHAVLRYLERIKGVDVDAARREMLTDGMDAKAIKYGVGEFPSEDGSFYLNVSDFTVKTCYAKLRPKHLPKRRKGR